MYIPFVQILSAQDEDILLHSALDVMITGNVEQKWNKKSRKNAIQKFIRPLVDAIVEKNVGKREQFKALEDLKMALTRQIEEVGLTDYSFGDDYY